MRGYSTHSGTWLIALSFFFAMLLEIFPMPDTLHALRPQWCAVVLIYWVTAIPHRVGIFTAFGAGLLMDVLNDTLLGQHALGYVIATFLAINIHRQIRVFPMWQQALAITGLLLLSQFFFAWTRGIAGYGFLAWSDWASVVSSGLISPLVLAGLRSLRLQFRVR